MGLGYIGSFGEYFDPPRRLPAAPGGVTIAA
jgi:hypothetical protein